VGKVIAVANMKGGVGKTATVIQLAETLAASGKSVLVIDADAQANASICIAGDDKLEELIAEQQTIDAFLDDVLIGKEKKRFADRIFNHASNVTHKREQLKISLLAASSQLRLLERELIFELTKQDKSLNAIVGMIFHLIKKELEAVSYRFDFVVIDCPPGISAIAEASIRLADLVIIPTIPDYLSTYGLKTFCSNLWKHNAYSGKHQPKQLPYVLATRARPIKIHKEFLDDLRADAETSDNPFRLFETVIPETAAVSFALSWRFSYPTFQSKWGPKQTQLFEQLMSETLEALNGR
jgi:chromosome partitioning protein